ncbi:peptidoglycan-recognition protein LC isoform X3 [Drosophila persimilis]|uniref:peptidoglycan-recognition protein LC isoform X3 n=1 Tax=Drosophila persimilis TaxID=7234 RepID=UPI000F074CF3|nr:peptidoglycan-recognition protein LC isoform X3 [Drosophila persimilis]XP_026849454.1 peptidoglycan-recognition protein LC isoform X3 [Drosophila persimilis]
MHVNYKRNMNGQPLSADMSNRIINLTTGKNCSTSSTDSGVILIDNVPNFKAEGPMTKDTSSSSDEEPQSRPKAEANTKSQDPKLISIEHTINISQSKGAKTSPTLSIRSTTISIVSIDENALDSSCIDSDSDVEGSHDDCTVQKLGQQISYPPNCSSQLRDLNQGLTLISRQVTPGQTEVPPPTASEAGAMAKQLLNGSLALATPTQTGPNSPQGIGSIALTNSTDVTFGDKHFYEGPVTIQQFLIDNRDKWKPGDCADGGLGAGQDNPAFNGRPQANGTPAGSKLDDPGQQAPMLCPYLPNTISRKAISITVAFVLLTTLLGIILATTTNLFGKTLNKIEGDIVLDGDLEMIQLKDWGGKPTRGEPDLLDLPVSRVIISHTASEGCESLEVCSYRARVAQSFHMDGYNWDQVGYNFMIGGDGRVYEGRGWDIIGAHALRHNMDSIGISFLGSFDKIKPTKAQLRACQLLIAEGVRLKKLKPDYKLYGHRQLVATKSPGDELYKIIQTWPHWQK